MTMIIDIAHKHGDDLRMNVLWYYYLDDILNVVHDDGEGTVEQFEEARVCMAFDNIGIFEEAGPTSRAP